MSRGPIPDKSPNRPRTPEVIADVQSFYALPGNDMGGNLHIVLDDGNLEDHAVWFCLERSLVKRDQIAARIARQLLAMTRTQRKRVYRNAHAV